MRAAALSLAVAIVLADSAIVTLALPEILRELGAEVGEVAWVLIAFNLVLALAAVPAARLCLRGDPALWCAAGVVAFAAASAGCALAGSLDVLIAARVAQAVGGAFVIVSCLELLEAESPRGTALWAAAGVAGAALGPVAGGLLTAAISWQSIFVVQVPVALVAAPAALALRGRVASAPTAYDRPHVAANVALALLSAALTAALFLLVLMLVEGWRRSPALAAVTVTVVPVAAFAARPLARLARAGTRAEAIAGALLMAGGLAGLAIPPGAELGWTVAPQVLVGLGLGLTVDSLTAVALADRWPRALHGGWTIAARHAGVVAGLAILTPIFTADLRGAQVPAREAIAALVLDAPLRASVKLDLAEALARQLAAERGRVPDLSPAFAALRLPPIQATLAAQLEQQLDDQLERAATQAFRNAFLIAALLALLALAPAAALRDPSASRIPTSHTRTPPTVGNDRVWDVGMRLAVAAIAAAALGAQVAAGGGDFVPNRPADPCRERRGPVVPARLEPLAERVVLAGLDATACDLQTTRERLVLSLDASQATALQSGLIQGLDRLKLPKVSAVLPEALDLADLPGIARNAIETVPDAVVDGLLPTRDLLRRTISELDFRQVLADLDDPARLEPVLRDAILAAAADQIVDRLV